MLNKNRADDFRHFLEGTAGDRHLPIVLVSTSNDKLEYLIDQRRLAKRLKGLAHVIGLKQRERWWQDDLPLAHACYNGAVRVYLPGYRRDDPSNVHKYWHPTYLMECPSDEVENEIVNWVVEKSQPRFRENAIIAQLEQEYIQEQQQAVVERQFAALRSQMEENKNSEIEAIFTDLYSENQRILAERDSLQVDLQRSNDEVRRLRYRLNQQPFFEDTLASGTPLSARLMLSKQAMNTFRKLDMHEQDDLSWILFDKLTNADLRNSQSELRQVTGGACYVYPRGRSANGRRVIYTLDRETVNVCEVFMNHDEYEDAFAKGIRLDKYEEYEELPLGRQADIFEN